MLCPSNAYSSAYSGGGSSRSARISCITRRKFSTSTRSPSTSVVEIDPPGVSGSLLDAEPVCEPTLDDVATDGGDWCGLVGVTSRRRSFIDRFGDGDTVVLSYVSISPAPIPAKPAVVSECVLTGT